MEDTDVNKNKFFFDYITIKIPFSHTSHTSNIQKYDFLSILQWHILIC